MFTQHFEKYAQEVYEEPSAERRDELIDTQFKVNIICVGNELALQRALEQGRALLAEREDQRLRYFIDKGESWVGGSSINNMNNMCAGVRLIRVMATIESEVRDAKLRQSRTKLRQSRTKLRQSRTKLRNDVEPFDEVAAEEKYHELFEPIVAPVSRMEHAERLRRRADIEMYEHVGRPLFEDFVVLKKKTGSKKKKNGKRRS